jgi:hypothetical protein
MLQPGKLNKQSRSGENKRKRSIWVGDFSEETGLAGACPFHEQATKSISGLETARGASEVNLRNVVLDTECSLAIAI